MAGQRQVTRRRAIALGETAMISMPADEKVQLSEGFRADVNGLDITGRPAIAAWAESLRTLRIIERGGQFAIGDAVVYGEDRYGEEASQFLDASEGWSEKTLSIYRWASTRIAKKNRRMDRLGIAHHLAVAALSEAGQKKWLTKAANDGEELPWTVGRLKAAIKAGEDQEVTGWFLIVACDTEARRDGLKDRLEREGHTVKARDSRSPKRG